MRQRDHWRQSGHRRWSDRKSEGHRNGSMWPTSRTTDWHSGYTKAGQAGNQQEQSLGAEVVHPAAVATKNKRWSGGEQDDQGHEHHLSGQSWCL